MAKERKWIDIDLGPTRPKRASSSSPEPDVGSSPDELETQDYSTPELAPTRPIRRGTPPAPMPPTPTAPNPPQHPAIDYTPEAASPTVPLGVRKKAATPDESTSAVFNPVVGWLVCIDGPTKGHAYELHPARNFIGRGEGMHVRLAEDASISADKHAIVSYDPRGNAYVLSLGPNTTQMVYLNDQAVYAPTPLAHGDRMQLGHTTLLFVPLCTDQFSWS